MEEAFSLNERWSDLIADAKRKDAQLITKKAEFAKVTE